MHVDGGNEMFYLLVLHMDQGAVRTKWGLFGATRQKPTRTEVVIARDVEVGAIAEHRIRSGFRLPPPWEAQPSGRGKKAHASEEATKERAFVHGFMRLTSFGSSRLRISPSRSSMVLFLASSSETVT